MKPTAGIKIMVTALGCVSSAYAAVGEFRLGTNKLTSVTLKEVTELALQNNRQLQIERINTEIAKFTLTA